MTFRSGGAVRVFVLGACLLLLGGGLFAAAESRRAEATAGPVVVVQAGAQALGDPTETPEAGHAARGSVLGDPSETPAAGYAARGSALGDPSETPEAGHAITGSAVGADAEAVGSAGAGTGAGSASVTLTTTASLQRPDALDTPWYQRVTSALGLIAFVLIAWLLSTDRRVVSWRVLLWGLGLQLLFALFILKTPVGEWIFAGLNDIVVALLGFTVEGAAFLFGNLVWNNVPIGEGPAGTNAPISAMPGAVAQTGAFFAFNVLPTIIFFASLMGVLYHLGLMQAIVKAFAWVMVRTMRTSGAETLATAGNIFVGQTEAPLLIKPFIGRMTMSELMVLMTGGFATVAGGVMAAYVGMMVAFFPGVAGHLVAASIMSAPAALAVAKLMYPERDEPATRGVLKVELEHRDANVVDAAARGAADGLTMALNVGAMLLAFIALIALLNAVLGLLGQAIGATAMLEGWGWLAPGEALSIERLLGWLLAPLAFIMGVPAQDAVQVGSLLGVKTVLNEFVAFLQLSTILANGVELAPRSVLITTYALAGFANFSSIAIQIGGIGAIAPSRRSDLSRLGLRAMVGGSLAAFMTATVAGMIV